MRIGKMLYSDSSKKTEKAVAQQQVFKRPHGVAVQNLGDYLTSKEGDNEEKEFGMKVRSYLFYLTILFYNFPINRSTKRKKKIFISSTSSLSNNPANIAPYRDT